jgi:serine/threonine-protein kinase
MGGAAPHELDEALKGKAGYMSPEHARGEAIDARADVFAAGIVLWELAAGRRMYKTGEGRATLLEQARRAAIPELTETALPAQTKLRAILAKALAPDRDARYPSAAAMQRDLDEYAAKAELMPSPLKLGDWLARTFGEQIVAERRARERAASALERGAPVVLEAVAQSTPGPIATAFDGPPPPPDTPPPRPPPAARRSPPPAAPHVERGRGPMIALVATVMFVAAVAATALVLAMR